MADLKIEAPPAPAGIPALVAKKWKKAFEDAFEEAQNDFPDDLPAQRQAAFREANRLLKTPELTSYSDAMDLEDFHVVLREPSIDGKTLRVVTRHGKKYNLPIPAKAQKAAAKNKDEGDGKTSTDATSDDKTKTT
jgi:hypothetical protein